MGEPKCCDPDHLVISCYGGCGKLIHTCEREEPENYSYLCDVPEHNNGFELSDGNWICSECFNRLDSCDGCCTYSLSQKIEKD